MTDCIDPCLSDWFRPCGTPQCSAFIAHNRTISARTDTQELIIILRSTVEKNQCRERESAEAKGQPFGKKNFKKECQNRVCDGFFPLHVFCTSNKCFKFSRDRATMASVLHSFCEENPANPWFVSAVLLKVLRVFLQPYNVIHPQQQQQQQASKRTGTLRIARRKMKAKQERIDGRRSEY